MISWTFLVKPFHNVIRIIENRDIAPSEKNRHFLVNAVFVEFVVSFVLRSNGIKIQIWLRKLKYLHHKEKEMFRMNRRIRREEWEERNMSKIETPLLLENDIACRKPLIKNDSLRKISYYPAIFRRQLKFS